MIGAMAIVPEALMNQGKTILLLGGDPLYTLRFRSELIRSLQDKGLIVHLVLDEGRPDTVRKIRETICEVSTVKLARTAMNPIADLGTILMYRRIIRRLRPDYLLAYGIKPIVYGSMAADPKRTSIAALITGRGQSFSGASMRQKAIRSVVCSLMQFGLKRCRHVIFQNRDDLSDFERRGWIRHAKTGVVAGSGVNLQQFVASPIPTRPVTFILISRLIENKGIREFVDAAKLLRGRSADARFQLLGATDQNRSSIPISQVRQWSREGFIEYLGETNDVRPHLSAASVFVLPSAYGEGVPRSILEALAVGRAIITSDTPGCRDTVVRWRNGLLVPPRDAAALASAMEHFIDNPKDIIAYGESSRRLAEDVFDVRKVNCDMLKLMGLEGGLLSS